jgi:hypothetical protein
MAEPSAHLIQLGAAFGDKASKAVQNGKFLARLSEAHLSRP